VLGGSLGASALNRLVPAALAGLAPPQRPQVAHQCGHAHVEATRAAYAAAGVAADVLPFIADVAARYAWADLVLCRAGAVTVAELAAGGVPSILVPLVASTTDHQQTNAGFLAARGAAIHLPQAEADPARLAALLDELGHDRGRLLRMAEAARALGRPDATTVIAAALERLGSGRR